MPPPYVQSDWGDVSLGGCATLRPPTTDGEAVQGARTITGSCYSWTNAERSWSRRWIYKTYITLIVLRRDFGLRSNLRTFFRRWQAFDSKCNRLLCRFRGFILPRRLSQEFGLKPKLRPKKRTLMRASVQSGSLPAINNIPHTWSK